MGRVVSINLPDRTIVCDSYDYATPTGKLSEVFDTANGRNRNNAARVTITCEVVNVIAWGFALTSTGKLFKAQLDICREHPGVPEF